MNFSCAHKPRSSTTQSKNLGTIDRRKESLCIRHEIKFVRKDLWCRAVETINSENAFLIYLHDVSKSFLNIPVHAMYDIKEIKDGYDFTDNIYDYSNLRLTLAVLHQEAENHCFLTFISTFVFKTVSS